jgi:zinc transport system substrate-binding protein
MKHKVLLSTSFAVLTAAVFGGLACDTGSESSDSSAAGKGQGTISVFVSILPQAFFVERIGGEHVAIQVLVGPGESPATYEPTPKQMAQMAESDLYFAIGVPFETAVLPRLRDSFKDLEIVETQAGIDMTPGLTGHGHEGHEGGHLDPHVWLSPRHAKVIARNIMDALTHVDSANADDYASNLTKLVADLDETDALVARHLESFRGEEMYVFHPAYGEFAEAYGLTQVAIEVEGQSPSARQLAEMIERARTHNVKAIFIQPQFSNRMANTVAEAVGAQVVTLDPLSRNYLTNLREMAEKIRDALNVDAEETVAGTSGH